MPVLSPLLGLAKQAQRTDGGHSCTPRGRGSSQGKSERLSQGTEGQMRWLTKRDTGSCVPQEDQHRWDTLGGWSQRQPRVSSASRSYH